MSLTRVDAAFETCEQHLRATNSFGTEVEAILTSYVTALTYAAFEVEVKRIIAQRGAGDGKDSGAKSFSTYAASRLLRSIKVSELAGAAGWFDPVYKRRFGELLPREAIDAWDTIIANRHGFAHDADGTVEAVVSNLTFRELQLLYPRALEVLATLESAIISI